MPDWLKVVLPIATPLIVAALTAALGAALAQPRRIRRDLAEDAAILPSLRGVARGLLSEDMHQNAIRLAAWRRYPGLLAWDYFRMFLIVGGVALQAYYTWDLSREGSSRPYSLEDPVAFAYPVALVAGAVYTLQRSWLWRSRDRNAMLEQHHVPIDPDMAWFWRIYGASAYVFFGTLVTIVPPVAVASALSHDRQWPRWSTLAIALAGTLCFMVTLSLLTRVEDKRPMTRGERQVRELEAYAMGERQASLRRERKKELGLRWYRRLPPEDRARIAEAVQQGTEGARPRANRTAERYPK